LPTRALFKMPKLNQTLQGKATTLIVNGIVGYAALQKETLTEEELLSVLHKQSFDTFDEVRRCVLEPNGTFYMEAKKPTDEEEEGSELLMGVRKLTDDVNELCAELRRRDDECNAVAG